MEYLGMFKVTALMLTLILGLSVIALAQSMPAHEEETPPQAILLNFKDASLDAVLEYLSEVAGFVVLKDVEVEGRISVIGRQALSADEAVALLNTVLKEKGYAAIRTGRSLKIVTLADAKKMNVPVRSGNDPEAIEPTDDVVTQVIPIRFVDAVKLKQDLAPLIPSYADLSANESSNALILTDTSANIRRIVEVVRALDTHMAAVAEVKVFQLQYASATDAARLVNEVFKQEETAAPRAGAPFFGGRSFRRLGGEEAPTAEGAGPSQKVTAAADERTNTVVVSGPPDTLKVVENVIKELDANPAEEQAVFVYYLKNAKAKNLETVLNSLFGQMEQARAQTGAAPSQQQPAQAQDQRASRREAFLNLVRQQASPTAVQAVAGLAGEVHVVADEDTNSLLVLTGSKNFDRVKEILADLDRPVPQAVIKVLIAEVTHDDSLDLGVEFSALNLRPVDEGEQLFTDFDVAAQSGGVIAKVVETNVTAALRALEEVGKLDVLSRPYILASDNQLATIIVGQEVPFITQTRTTETGQTINTISYEDIGIILNVTPHINPQGLVIMDVSPEISALTGTTVPISETVSAPVFAKRSAQTRVGIVDGQTIVIGGLMEDRKTKTIRKVPLLGDIPLLGGLFRRTIEAKAKTELLIFLTPHVAPEPETLQAMSQDEMAGSKLVPGAVAPGAFDEQTKGMERGGARPEEQKDESEP